MKFGLAVLFILFIEACCTAGNIGELGDNKQNGTKM
jgi:hypothetical protein